MSDIAVIGIAVRFPRADTLAEFRANLLAGLDCVGPLPRERAENTNLDPDLPYERRGYLDRIDLFDHRFFGLSRREAELMDPQHRAAVQLAHAAVEDAGFAVTALRDTATAVVFSAPTTDYAGLVTETGTLAMLGTVPCALPARVAHQFGLTGPCYAVDCGCNASLVAVHQAAREIRSGDAEFALAGGVAMHPVPALATGDTGGFQEIMSVRSQVRAFDADADGTVPGEGGAVLLLTTMERALADRTPIHAVLRGSAVSHNGRASATISTPSAAAQTAVIGRAWRAAGLDFASAGYLEAHGSGTRLGDAIEIEGLRAARATGPKLPIGSVKTNIGHLDHAAGIAGLIKAILSVRHGELYPSLHFRRPADGVDLAAAGVRVATAVERWQAPDGGPRRAGVSSFSLGGTNAHCVVEQAPAPAATVHSGALLVGVSARTRDDLITLCGRLAVELRAGDRPLADVGFTLNEGRDHHPCRVAVVARDTADLATALAARATWLRADPGPEPVTRVVLVLSGDARIPDNPAPPAAVVPVPANDVGTAAVARSPDNGGGPGLPAALPARGPAARLLAAQLAAHRGLVAAGVPVDAVLSSGVSRYAARWLRGELSDVDTRALAAGTPDTRPADPGRLRDTVATLTAGGPVAFVEVGDGEIGRLLTGSGVVPLRTDGDLTGVLGRLYEHGVDIDWAAVRGDRPGRRVSLPGHPLVGTRCWARPLGELLPLGPPGEAAPVEAAPVEAAPVETTPVSALPWLRHTLGALLYSDDVPADADYFDLGGNSVIALQLIDRAADAHGVRLSLLDIYDHPVVSDLAAEIGRRSGAVVPEPVTEPEPGLPPITPGDELVLSFGQERMWFHHQLDPATTLYNLPAPARMRGPFDADAFRAAWEDLAARHEVLRSNFVERDGRPELVIRPTLGDFFHEIDVSGAADPAAAARRVMTDEYRHVFDVARDPLVRIVVIRLADDDHVTFTTMHHAVNDGWAPAVLQAELTDHLVARTEGTVRRRPPLPIQYRDYARWQRQLLEGPALDAELDYWRDALRDPPVLALPTDLPRPARRDYAGDFHTFVLPADLVDDLRAVGRQESATLFAVLLSGLFALLGGWCRQGDVVVGTPTIGRTRPELWELIGFFNNTIALRGDLADGPTFAELVRRTRHVVRHGLEHQEVPFDRVVKAVAPPRDAGRSPLFDVMYVHQTLPPTVDGEVGRDNVVEGGDGADPFPGLPPGTAKFDLSLVLGEHMGRADIVATLEYSTQLFHRATIERLAETFVSLLRAAADDPETRCENLPTVPETSSRPAVPANPVLDLPTDLARPARPGPADATHAFTVAPDRADEDTVLAAFAALLALRCNQDDLVLGAPAPAGEPMPVALDLGDDPGLATVVERVRAARRVTWPAAALDGLAAARAAPNRHPLFDACLVHGDTRPDTDLALSLAPDGAAILAYRADLFLPTTVADLADDLVALLDAMADEPDRPVFDALPTGS